MFFKINTIPFEDEYKGYLKILTASFYTKRKHVSFDALDEYSKRGLALTGATYVRYENNPAFNTEVRFHTMLCAN